MQPLRRIVATVLAVIAFVLAGRSALRQYKAPSSDGSIPSIASQNPLEVERSSPSSVGAHAFDPTLRDARLKLAEDLVYEGTGRNIFQSTIENQAAKKPPSRAHSTSRSVSNSSSPAVGLRFFGFVTTDGRAIRGFLLEDDAVFIASEGDVVGRHFKILRITPSYVDVEDLLNEKRDRLVPLFEEKEHT